MTAIKPALRLAAAFAVALATLVPVDVLAELPPSPSLAGAGLAQAGWHL